MRVILNKWDGICPDATLKLSPVKARAARTPILVDAPSLPSSARTVKTLSTGYIINRMIPFLALILFLFPQRTSHITTRSCIRYPAVRRVRICATVLRNAPYRLYFQTQGPRRADDGLAARPTCRALA